MRGWTTIERWRRERQERRARGPLLNGIERLLVALGPGVPQPTPKPKANRKPSDATPRRRVVYGRLKHPGEATGPACGKCKIAVKRIRRRVEGNTNESRPTRKAKISECPRCKAQSAAAVV